MLTKPEHCAFHLETCRVTRRTSRLFSLGIGYVDAQLLAATRLTADAALWTSDRRLHAPAQRLGVAYAPQTDG